MSFIGKYLPFRLGFYVHESEIMFAFVLNEFTWDFKLKGNLTYIKYKIALLFIKPYV